MFEFLYLSSFEFIEHLQFVPCYVSSVLESSHYVQGNFLKMRIMAKNQILHKETNRSSRTKTLMTKLNNRIDKFKRRSDKLNRGFSKVCDSSKKAFRMMKGKKNKRNSVERQIEVAHLIYIHLELKKTKERRWKQAFPPVQGRSKVLLSFLDSQPPHSEGSYILGEK